MESKKLICQCCGMPLEESIFSKEVNGEIIKDYCMWCYHDGKFTYSSKEELINYCVTHFANENMTEEEMRIMMEEYLPTLKHWKE